MNLIQAIIDLCKYYLIYMIDTGDRALNTALVAVCTIGIEMAFGKLSGIGIFWQRYWYRRDVSDLADGELKYWDIVDLLKKHSNYIKADNIYDCNGPTRELAKLAVKKIIAEFGLLSPSGYLDLTRFQTTYNRVLNSDPNTDQSVRIPLYKFGSDVVYVLISDNSGLDGWFLYTNSFNRGAIQEKLKKIYRSADDVLQVMTLKPKMDPYQRNTTPTIIIKSDLPSDKYFIHKDRVTISSRLEEFKTSASSGHIKIPRLNNLGIMLWGKPGCGKTTFVSWACEKLGRSCVALNLSDPGWTTTDLQLLLTSPERYISMKLCEVVFFFDEFDESGDCIRRDAPEQQSSFSNIVVKDVNTLNALKQVKHDEKDRLKLSSLLTTIDGIHQVYGRVIIACTNRIEQIDPALLREGRLGDIRIELDDFGPTEAIQAFELYKDPPADYAERLGRIANPLAPAEFINQVYRLSPEDLLKSLGV